jgi:predicted dithiol-disulfide oxidoreductase (DUF899 family)
MQPNPIVSEQQWVAARKRLLDKEKQLTKLREELSAERRALPWVEVTKRYEFEGPDGIESLTDLFGGHSQLIVKHFMFGPGWAEGCVGCSFHADHMDGANLHLGQRDVTLLAVSRAPFAEIDLFKQRMGWRFKWVSSYGSDFNYDFHVSFRPEEVATGRGYYNYEVRDVQIDELSGLSVFYKDEGDRIFHTYSTFARGAEVLLGTYNYLDLVPKGRDETGPRGNLSDWVRHHDRYDSGGHVEATGRYVSADADHEGCH